MFRVIARRYNHLKEKIKSILGLSFSFAKANFKLRNEGSYLGIFWYLLNPLALFLIILFIKNQAFVHVGIPYYPIYLLIGLLFHNFFVNIVGASINTIPSNGNFIKSIKIPLESLVLSRVFQSVFSHLFEFALIIFSLLYFGISLEGLFVYFVVFVLFIVFISGFAFVFATLGVYFSDLNNVWIVASQLLFFITPIFYAPVAGSLLYKVNLFNPIYYFMSAGREMFIYNNYPRVELLAGLFIMSVLSLFIGLFVFNKNKARFAELV